jgi:Zn-dependent protease with chaperone function
MPTLGTASLSSLTRTTVVRNTAKTVVLLSGLGGLLVLAGSLIGGATGTVIGLIAGLAIVGGSYWFSDRLAIRSSGARPVADGELPWLQADVVELARRAGMPPPRLYVSPDAQPNAFATPHLPADRRSGSQADERFGRRRFACCCLTRRLPDIPQVVRFDRHLHERYF